MLWYCYKHYKTLVTTIFFFSLSRALQFYDWYGLKNLILITHFYFFLSLIFSSHPLSYPRRHRDNYKTSLCRMYGKCMFTSCFLPFSISYVLWRREREFFLLSWSYKSILLLILRIMKKKQISSNDCRENMNFVKWS